jgi:hypothetical protein
MPRCAGREHGAVGELLPVEQGVPGGDRGGHEGRC